jgi:hypothetical protein
VSAAAEAKIKGLAFREFVRWYNTEHGPHVLQESAGTLPVELRAQLDLSRPDFGILAGSWYPVLMATSFLEAITRGLATDARTRVLREVTDNALGNMLSGVYRSLFEKLVTPERHARYAQNIFRTFYNTGTVVGRVLEPGRAEQTVSDWTGHHPLLCELSVLSLATFHRAMKLSNVNVTRTSCIATGAPSCHFVIRWDP